MEEYGDIYYIDDTRNATRDHRAQGGRPVRPGRTLVAAGSYRPSYTQQQAPVYTQQAPVYTQQAPVYTQQAPVYYAQQPIMVGEPGLTAGSLLGRLTIAQLIEIAAGAFAALQPLPPAPNPQKDTETNTQNLIVYQKALAEHAKRDEQIRTLASLVSKLAG